MFVIHYNVYYYYSYITTFMFLINFRVFLMVYFMEISYHSYQ